MGRKPSGTEYLAGHGRRGSLHPNLIGGWWILLSAMCFTVATSFVKYLGVSYSAPSQAFFSQSAGILLMLPYTLTHVATVLRPSRPRMMLVRSGLSTLAVILAYSAYHQLPLADANALSFTRTLWVFPFAALMLGEKIRPSIIVAGCVAFAGVLLIGGLAGGNGNSIWGMAAGLGSAMSAALTLVAVRSLSKQVDGKTMLVWSSLLGVVFSAPIALLTGWEWPRLADLGLMMVQGAFTLAQQACYIKGLQIGEASAVVPIDNFRVVFTIVIGLVVFHEVPTLSGVAGIILIVGSALFIMLSLGPKRAARPEAVTTQ